MTTHPRKCSRPKCHGDMLPGIAIDQTYGGGTPDLPGGEVVTVSPGGPGVVIDCLKCNVCGHSVTQPIVAALVEFPDGSLSRKPFADLRPEDRVVFDGPDAFSHADAAQVALDAEILAAGGLDAWRASD